MSTHTSTDRTFCSRISAEAGAPLAGSAAGGIREWVGIELDGGWESRAIESEGVPPDLRTVLEAWQTPAHRRVVFLRTRPAEARHVWLARGGVLWRWELTGADDLHAALEGALPDSAEQVDEPVVWVCTHGKRDMCCARWGMPLYRRLVELGGVRAMQVSHLGGHRFAATALVMPEGVLYGRLDQDDAERLTEVVTEPTLWLDRMRGRTTLSPRAQAAEIAARRAAGRPGASLRHVEEHHAHVVISLDEQRYTVLTHHELGPELRTSCTSDVEKPTSWWRCEVA